MSQIKPSSHGIVVENKESGVWYASTDANYDPTSERKVRDLKPGETVFGYTPKLGSAEDAGDGSETASETPAATPTPATTPTTLGKTDK